MAARDVLRARGAPTLRRDCDANAALRFGVDVALEGLRRGLGAVGVLGKDG